MGQKWAQKIQLGRETTPGTAVAATTIWRGVGGNLHDTREIEAVDEQIGMAVKSNRAYLSKVGGALDMAATPATFQQLCHILEAGIKAVGTGAADGAGSGKIYNYAMGSTAVNAIKTYTIETGDNQQAEEMEYSFVESFTLSGERGQPVMMSANWLGRQVTNTTFTPAPPVPAVEEIITGRGSFFIDAIGGTLGATPVTGVLLSWELKVDTGWRGKWVVDKGQLYFDFHYFDIDSFGATFSATYEHDATAVTEKGHWRSNTPRLIRLSIPGSTNTTPGTLYTTKMMILDMACRYTTFDALDADEGNSIVKLEGSIGYDSTAGKSLAITLVNELVSIP